MTASKNSNCSSVPRARSSTRPHAGSGRRWSSLLDPLGWAPTLPCCYGRCGALTTPKMFRCNALAVHAGVQRPSGVIFALLRRWSSSHRLRLPARVVPNVLQGWDVGLDDAVRVLTRCLRVRGTLLCGIAPRSLRSCCPVADTLGLCVMVRGSLRRRR